jgi:hypothetical protein
MELILNDRIHKVKLQTVLSQNLYVKVMPILEKLENSRGAQKAYETLLQKRLLGDEYFSGKFNLLKGSDAWEGLKGDFKLQEVIAEVILQIKTNVFEYISLDEQTIPIVFDLAKIAIDRKNINDNELLIALDSDSSSDFWMEQDLNSILEELKFFRSNTLARIKTSFGNGQ